VQEISVGHFKLASLLVHTSGKDFEYFLGGREEPNLVFVAAADLVSSRRLTLDCNSLFLLLTPEQSKCQGCSEHQAKLKALCVGLLLMPVLPVRVVLRVHQRGHTSELDR